MTFLIKPELTVTLHNSLVTLSSGGTAIFVKAYLEIRNAVAGLRVWPSEATFSIRFACPRLARPDRLYKQTQAGRRRKKPTSTLGIHIFGVKWRGLIWSELVSENV